MLEVICQCWRDMRCYSLINRVHWQSWSGIWRAGAVLSKTWELNSFVNEVHMGQCSLAGKKKEEAFDHRDVIISQEVWCVYL